jgi:hypothetical protein
MANRQSGPQDLSIGDIICQKICLIYLPTHSLPLPIHHERESSGARTAAPPCFLMAHPGLTSIMTDSPFRHPSAWFNRFRTEFFKCLVIPRSAATSHESSVARPQLLRLTCPRQYLMSINPLVFHVDLAIRLYHYSHLCRLFISHDNAHLAQTRLPDCLPQPSLAQTQLSDPLSYTCRLSTIGQVHPPGR